MNSRSIWLQSKKQGGFGNLPSFIHTYTCIHTYIHTYIYIHIEIYIYIYWIWFWQMGQGHESPPSFLLTSTVPVCWGGVCSHTQMGGVVTVIDPNLPRVIWLGNEISCKFLQYLGGLRFYESTCACCHVAYVAIFGVWIVLSGPDAPPSLLWLPFSTKWWHLGLCHRTSAQSWDFLPHSVGFQPGSQSSGLIVHMVLEAKSLVSKPFVTKNKCCLRFLLNNKSLSSKNLR